MAGLSGGRGPDGRFKTGNSFGSLTAGRKEDEEHKRKRLAKIRGVNHGHWKGDDAGYRAVHIWVWNNWGAPEVCAFCGEAKTGKREMHWCNLDKQYRRVREQWIPACASCHKQYDNGTLAYKGWRVDEWEKLLMLGEVEEICEITSHGE